MPPAAVVRLVRGTQRSMGLSVAMGRFGGMQRCCASVSRWYVLVLDVLVMFQWLLVFNVVSIPREWPKCSV